MANDVKIKAGIEVDASLADKSLKDLHKDINDSKKALLDAKIGSDEYIKAQQRLQQAQQSLRQATQGSNEEHSKSTGAFGALKDKVGSIVPGFKSAEQGVGSFNMSLKAMMANPIVLLIAAIVLGLKFLYDAFTSTREGAEKVEQVFAGLSAAVQVIVDRALALGRAILKFFTGDFKGAIEDAKKAVSGIGDEIEREYNRTVELKKRLQDIKKEEIQDSLDKSVREKRLAMLREQMNDENVSAREKLKIAKQLRDDAIANSKEDLERTKRKIEAEIELIKMKANWEKDHLEEVTNLQIELNKVETENALEVVRVNKQVRAAQKQVDAEAKQASDEAKAKAKEAREAAKAEREKEIAYQQQLRKQQNDIELAGIKDLHAKELRQLQIRIEDEKAANLKAVEDGKLKKEQAAALNANVDKMAAIQREEIEDKYRKQAADKERAFQQELAKIRLDITLQGITDVRERERVQLKVGYEEKLKQAEERYKDDAAKLAEIRTALDMQYNLQRKAMDKKYADEDYKAGQTLSLRKIDFEMKVAKGDLDAKKRLLDEKQRIIEEQYQKEINASDLSAQKKAEIEQKHNEDLQALADARQTIHETEMKNREAMVASTGNALNAIADAVGKNTVVGKGLAVAKALMDTYAGIAAGVRLGFPQAVPAVIAASATGFKAVKDILAVKVPGQSGGAATANTNAPVTPQNATTRLDNATINAVGNAAASGVNRAFVLETDIANNAERTARINRAARLS